MHINIITLFPEFFDGPLSSGLMQRAREKGLISFSLHNPRDLAEDRHRTVDDRPYGGGPGMLMLPGPLAATLRRIGFPGPGVMTGHGPHAAPAPGRLVHLTPRGRPLDQRLARELALAPGLTLLCGRYEGIDSRLEELFPMEGVSVGDFVLNGGESAALCLVEAVGRLLPGFMGHESSGEDESFSGSLLEYPQYTRPEVFEGLAVPEVLRSGDHGRIRQWRRQESLKATLANRPELLGEAGLDRRDWDSLRSAGLARLGKNLHCALVHYPVLDKEQKSVAVSLTNLDIHDIARSSCTYGLGGYYVISPLQDQRNLLRDIVEHWVRGPGARSNPDRARALSLVRGLDGIESAIEEVERTAGMAPLVVGTAAQPRPDGVEITGFRRITEILETRPVLLVLGTGHGLAPEAAALCHCFAPPIRPLGAYNHLSVRAAAAILLDRILGDWK